MDKTEYYKRIEYYKEYYKKNKKDILKKTKEYRVRPKVKVMRTEYRAKPENRLKQKEYMQEYYPKNKELLQAKTKIYFQKHKKHLTLKRKEWVKNNRGRSNKIKTRWRKKYPEKIKAQQIAYKIPLGKECQICGSKIKLERHHWRYDKPKLFATLCEKCHKIQHRRKLL